MGKKASLGIYLSLVVLLIFIYMYNIFNYNNFKESFQVGDYILPKIVWTHWDTNRPPKIIRDILENREKVMKGWDLRFITDDTIYKYIDKKIIPHNFWNLSAPHRADWIRLAVLKEYGGVWMDAGIIVNKVSAMDSLYEETINTKSMFTGFYPNDGLNSKGYPSYIDNWFIMAPKESTIIVNWLKEYELAISMGFKEYKKKITQTPTEFSEYNVKDLNDVYLTVQACLQYYLQSLPSRPNILLYNAKYSMMKIHADCSQISNSKSSHSACIKDTILNKPETHEIPYIKLRKEDREFDISSYFQKI
jgi:hypothetical protein